MGKLRYLVVGGTFCVLSTAECGNLLAAEASRPPNFVFVLADDLRWKDLARKYEKKRKPNKL